MENRLVNKVKQFSERHFPERRIFMKSNSKTRYIRLRPSTQLIVIGVAACLIAWTGLSTAMLLMMSIGADDIREQTQHDKKVYQERIETLIAERDAQTQEAIQSRNKFNSALKQISTMQSELFASEIERKELKTGLEAIQLTLREIHEEIDQEKKLTESANAEDITVDLTEHNEVHTEVADLLAEALINTAVERDDIEAYSKNRIEELQLKLTLMEETNRHIFRKLKEAIDASITPLEKMFSKVELPTDQIIELVRRGYSGRGGPLGEIALSRINEQRSVDIALANEIFEKIDRLNLYRIAASKIPFAMPVSGVYRYTSGYGFRSDPINRQRRMHHGIDLAAAHGTDINAAGDGVVTFSGWRKGYGKVIEIDHGFGIETVYAHNSKNRVKRGQRVSLGDHIADMGNTGRSTGTHLHYEIRINGKSTNPMVYIRAGRDVF
ncbi:MAG: DUF5930 domain-containing protein [Aestuariivita sp.]|nr:DUF5930 domain-containing protein [Aestuariivita sp.]